jgi:phage terminase large subunit
MEWPPNYSGELDRRLRLEHRLTSDRELLAGALLQYEQRPADFISDCVYLYEPRNASTGEPVMLPCVLFQRQREFIAWLHERFQTKTSAPVEKSRDSGATWMSAAFAVWVWLFHPGSTVGFGSRKEILVDRAGDLQSIFEKIRSIVRN